LCREHVSDLGRPDAEGEGAERPVRRRVAVAAERWSCRDVSAEFGTDHMDDTAPVVAFTVQCDSEVLHSVSSVRICSAAIGSAEATPPWIGGDAVVDGRDRPFRPATCNPRSRRTENACGEVTSWTRWRSMYRSAGARGSGGRNGRPDAIRSVRPATLHLLGDWLAARRRDWWRGEGPG